MFSQNVIKKSQFDEQVTVSKSQIINLKSIYGISALRDVVDTEGSATVTNESGEYKLTTTANGADKAILESAEQGRYYSGQDALAGVGVRLSSIPTGSQSARWGYYDDNNGFGFGRDADGLFVFDRTGATETKVYQQDWNNDKADGTGPDGVNLNMMDGLIYEINFTWYGYGTIAFNLVYFDNVKKRQGTIIVHRIRKTGSVSIEDPNLPLRAEIDNGGSATAFDSLYIGGRQFTTFGVPANPRRITSERRTGVTGIGTTFVPLVSFRRKEVFESVSVKINGIDVITDFDAIVEVRFNPTLTGASFGNVTNTTPNETAIESDTSATAITGGELVYSFIVSATGAGAQARGSATVPLIEQDFVRMQPVSVAIRRITGEDGTASCVFRIAEEW